MKRIEATLRYISEQLWSHNASIMVGAGFSMNADCVSTDDKKFPTWNELAEKFYLKIHGVPPDHKTNLNPMKLAEEIEAMFGRTILDNGSSDILGEAKRLSI